MIRLTHRRSGVRCSTAPDKAVAVKTEQQQAMLALHRIRSQLMKFRLMQTNTLHGLLADFQQTNLFKISFPSYIKRARGFYNRYKSANAVSWEDMDERMRDIFIDMIYQGSMRIRYVSFFEENNPDAVISLIKNISSLAAYDKSRKRVVYLKGAK